MKFLMLILLLYHIPRIYALSCDSKPRGASGPPNLSGTKFRIVIATNPERYIPNHAYNVTLQGKNSVIEDAIQFNGFSLTVEPKDIDQMSSAPDPLAAGLLEVFADDLNAKIDESCANMVVHTSHTFMSRVDVQWKAPPPGKGCVMFKAAIMEQNVWYQNGGGLTLELCEDDNMKSDDTVEECEACNEAKYEMKFEGMWTRQSHPLYFPGNVWLTRFSDVIGASHGSRYRLWNVDATASDGLAQFLNYENTTTLETEIKSNETRTVIKAKGLRYPGITGKTFAVFRVDKDHHLLSIISLIIPSPDWFVGVSGLNLCNRTEWIAEKTLDLYPYDLGLNDGVQYTSKGNSTSENIRKIEDDDQYLSPFHTNNTEKLKPLARVHLLRSRIYERNCENKTQEEERPAYTDNTRMTNYYSKGSDATNSRTEIPIVEDACVGANCSKCYMDPQLEISPCSIPECDSERVRGQFANWNEETRKYCIESNIVPENIVRYGCRSECSTKEEIRLEKERQKLSSVCLTTNWEYFSSCDPNTCLRTRNRRLQRDEDKANPKCLKIIFMQTIECSNCVTNSQQKKGEQWKPKSPNKYNVTISAAYTYTVQLNPKLCNNTNSTSNDHINVFKKLLTSQS